MNDLHSYPPYPETATMPNDVELLPSSVVAFVEALKGERGSLDAWLEVNNEREVAAHVEAYANATTANDAEIEALRADVDRLEAESQSRLEACGDAVSKLCAAQARAERLAEAGRRVTAAFRAHGETSPFTREAEITRYECEAAMLSLDVALKQEAK